MSLVFLSHELSENTPFYGGRPGFKVIEKSNRLNEGASRSEVWRVPNHLGTHIDFPAHFVAGGRTCETYKPTELLFKKVAFAEIKFRQAELIMPSDLKLARGIGRAELLLLKTGAERQRPGRGYVFKGPGLHPKTCRWLRERAPNLRCIGFDFISLTSYAHRELGREAHRILLGKMGRKTGLMIVEDMHLSRIKRAPKWVLVSPIRVAGTDGSPVTVFAEI